MVIKTRVLKCYFCDLGFIFFINYLFLLSHFIFSFCHLTNGEDPITYQAGGIQPQQQLLPAVAEPVAEPAAVPDVGASECARAYARECERDTRARCQPSATGPSGQQPEPVARPAGHGGAGALDGRPLPLLAPHRLPSVSLNPTAPR